MARPLTPHIGGRAHEMIAAYESGLTMQTVADRFGCSLGSVFKAFKRHGYNARDRRRHARKFGIEIPRGQYAG